MIKVRVSGYCICSSCSYWPGNLTRPWKYKKQNTQRKRQTKHLLISTEWMGAVIKSFYMFCNSTQPTDTLSWWWQKMKSQWPLRQITVLGQTTDTPALPCQGVNILVTFFSFVHLSFLPIPTKQQLPYPDCILQCYNAAKDLKILLSIVQKSAKLSPQDILLVSTVGGLLVFFFWNNMIWRPAEGIFYFRLRQSPEVDNHFVYCNTNTWWRSSILVMVTAALLYMSHWDGWSLKLASAEMKCISA